MQTVSVYMIIRDEAPVIRNALDSIYGKVDEIVLVDTGSEDDTLKIVEEEYPDVKVHHFEWEDHFSNARNFAMGLCTGDWHITVDGDDILEGAENLKVLANRGGNTNMYYLPYKTSHALEFFRERLAKNDGGWQWVGAVHEVLCRVDGKPVHRANSDMVKFGHKPNPDGERSTDRNLRIHRKEFEKNIEDGLIPDQRSFFYFANDLKDSGHWIDAIRYYWQYVHQSVWPDAKYQAMHWIGDCYRNMQLYHEAILTDLLAIRFKSDWPDAYFGIADTFWQMGKPNKTVYWSELGFKQSVPKNTDVFLDMGQYKFWPHVRYAQALEQSGYPEAAAENYKKATEFFEDPWVVGKIEELG